MTALVPVTRPDGRVYRPRKVIALGVADADDFLCGVVVLGTHDVTVARLLAEAYARWQTGEGTEAAEPEAGWFREGLDYGNPVWMRDEVRGRAGVWFHELLERADPGTDEDLP
jgi:hypothetical protein